MQSEEREPGWKSALVRAGIILGAVIGGLVGLLSLLSALLRRDGRPAVSRQRRAISRQPSAVSDEGETEAENQHSALRTPQSGWSAPRPEELPPPTYWPAVMALGIVLMVWGLVSTFVISGVGLALFALALAGWIGDLRHVA
ncbi:MAG: hypothetical protein ACR2M0_09860 [Chloroflexia bacterium]